MGEDVLLGTTIGAYRVARLLGIGGMGRVYKGVHPTIGSRVAIKVLSRECSDRRDLVERFFAEAKAVNLIRHESIVNVLDLAMLPDGRPYIIRRRCHSAGSRG
jgi:serine/threonine-protein kinase